MLDYVIILQFIIIYDGAGEGRPRSVEERQHSGNEHAEQKSVRAEQMNMHANERSSRQGLALKRLAPER